MHDGRPGDQGALLTGAGGVPGVRHLRRVLTEYLRHYNAARPHRARGQLAPAQAHAAASTAHPRPDRPVADLSRNRIKRRPVLSGLLNEYERAS